MKSEEIYKEYADIVFRYLMCLCRNPDLAEEMTQETFCRAIQASFKVSSSCRVSTWLCQIAKHVWYQEVAKRKRYHTCPPEELPEQTAISPEDVYLVKEERRELFSRIERLQEAEKEVVLLRIAGEFSFREIGELTKRSENWARVTFYRAKQKLISMGRKKEDGDEM